MRYRQVQNQAGEWELWEVEEAPRGQPRLQIMGAKPHENYVSPIDGSVITSQRAERRHKEEHGVIHQSELGNNFGQEYYARQKKERDQFLSGESQKHKREVRKEMDVVIEKLKQGVPPAKPREGELA